MKSLRGESYSSAGRLKKISRYKRDGQASSSAFLGIEHPDHLFMNERVGRHDTVFVRRVGLP